jgi:polysaccharide biosynthesis protein PslH
VSGDILFLAHRLPFPPDRGDKIRSWNVLKALTQLAPVHVAALTDFSDNIEQAGPLRDIVASITLSPRTHSSLQAMVSALATGRAASVEAFASQELQSKVGNLLEKKSITSIYTFSSQMAQYVPTGATQRFVMDFVDMDSAKFQTYAKQKSGISAFANAQESKRLFRWEKAVAERADLSLFVSEAEAALFRSNSGMDPNRVRVLENGIDLDHFAPNHIAKAIVPGDGPLLVFTGQMDYPPNVDAVRWFAAEVMPKLPDARFAIVGRAPTPAVMALADGYRIIVTDEVADTRDWIAAADLVVAPLLLARGVQNKILEAMAMGKLVIATPAAAEGIVAQAGTEIEIAESADAFVRKILILCKDGDVTLRRGPMARKAMESRYGWAARMAGLSSIMFPNGAQP